MDVFLRMQIWLPIEVWCLDYNAERFYLISGADCKSKISYGLICQLNVLLDINAFKVFHVDVNVAGSYNAFI